MHHPKALQICGSCGAFARQDDLLCPSCGASDLPAARAALLVALGLAACGEKDPDDSQVMAEYGVADTSSYLDQDGDGFTPAEGDCDDNDAAVNPNATETTGDAVDSNCDGNNDT